MMGEVLEAVAATNSLAGIIVVTVDPQAAALATRLGARVVTDGARDGHTGSVMGGVRLLAQEGRGGMLTLPADIPAVTSQEISLVDRRAPAGTRPSRSRRRTTISAPTR